MSIPTNKKYIDYEGLQEYHRLMKQWVIALLDKEHKDISTEIRLAIDNAFENAIDTGTMDDIRTYPTYNDFPEIGIPGVQYVDESNDIEYQWIIDAEHEHGGYYTQINKIATSEDIEDLF